MHLLEELERSQLRKDFPPFKAGDTVRVYFRIREGEKERVQYFEGIVIGFHRNAVSSTFKVRKESYGVGVERTFPLHSRITSYNVCYTKLLRNNSASLAYDAANKGRGIMAFAAGYSQKFTDMLSGKIGVGYMADAVV